MVVKRWSNDGQAMVKRCSNDVQTMSNDGQTMVKHKLHRKWSNDVDGQTRVDGRPNNGQNGGQMMMVKKPVDDGQTAVK